MVFASKFSRLPRWMLSIAALLVCSLAGGQGVVNVYSARHYDTDRTLYDQFTADTGIEVNLLEASSDQLLARLRSEGAGSPADVYIAVDAARLKRAEDQGVFQPVSSGELAADLPEALRHPEGLWVALTTRARVIVVSRERIDESVELNYEDLASPTWRDRVLVRSSSNVYNQSLVASMIATVGADEAEAWCRGLVGNFARKPQGGDRDQIRAVAAGEGDAAIVNHYYYMRMLTGSDADREAAGKVRVVFPNQDDRGTHINICGAGVVSTAPNRANAIRFLEFLLSDDVQESFASGNQEYPAANGVAAGAALDSLGPFKADTVNIAKLSEHNTDAVKIMDKAGWR